MHQSTQKQKVQGNSRLPTFRWFKRGPAKITHRRLALSQPDDDESGMETGDEVSKLSGASINDFQKV
jgi:hypothetical protein